MTRLESYRQIEILAFGRDVIGKLLSCVILVLAFEGLLRLQMCPDHPENVTYEAWTRKVTVTCRENSIPQNKTHSDIIPKQRKTIAPRIPIRIRVMALSTPKIVTEPSIVKVETTTYRSG